MRLYTWAKAPNPRRVIIFAAEKQIELEVVDVGDGAGLRKDFLATSPSRTVPVLELDDGTQIGEAMAICRTLEALHPDPPLLGRTPAEIGLVHMWEHICELDGLIGASEILRNRSKAFEERGLPGHERPVPQIAALIERGQLRVESLMQRLDRQLAVHRFIVGDGITMADISALCAVDFGVRCKVPIPDGFSHLRRWHAEMAKRPSIRG